MNNLLDQFSVTLNNIQDRNVITQLAKDLQTNKKVRVLNLRSNCITGEVAIKIAEIFKKNSTITELDLGLFFHFSFTHK